MKSNKPETPAFIKKIKITQDPGILKSETPTINNLKVIAVPYGLAVPKIIGSDISDIGMSNNNKIKKLLSIMSVILFKIISNIISILLMIIFPVEKYNKSPH